jgi:hypothetical protein
MIVDSISSDGLFSSRCVLGKNAIHRIDFCLLFIHNIVFIHIF